MPISVSERSSLQYAKPQRCQERPPLTQHTEQTHLSCQKAPDITEQAASSSEYLPFLFRHSL